MRIYVFWFGGHFVFLLAFAEEGRAVSIAALLGLWRLVAFSVLKAVYVDEAGNTSDIVRSMRIYVFWFGGHFVFLLAFAEEGRAVSIAA
ncbi:hypothetical protein B1A92_12460, partial [Neisseria meningitidis]